LERFKPYLILRQAKWCLEASIEDFSKRNEEMISLKSERASRGNVLVSFMNEGFFLKPSQPIPNDHISYWKTVQMADTFRELGYSVDIIHHRNLKFLPQKDYSVVVDTRHNLERIAPFLDKKCVKIMHLDTAHILFHNAAEANRLLALQQRRKVTLAPSRHEIPNLGIEHADCATTCGNEFTISTFRYANKPIYRLPVPVSVSCPWPTGKSFEACRKRFFWFASYGMVHKGLDLVLEAFAKMPGFHLTVCGPVEKEPAFVQAYRKELYHTPNIQTIGWLNTDSEQFRTLTETCVAHVYTSCSEGGGACVLETMHMGLIPLVSYETSVDVHDFGVMLKSASIEDIQDGVRIIAEMPAVELERRARKAWGFARENHTRNKFAEAYRKTVETIIARHC
jgi:glycosyltransferase involved in cell wall biosynthesis